MKFVLYTNCVSAHQLPLAREIAASVGNNEFRYVSDGEGCTGNQCVKSTGDWITSSKEDLSSCETLLVGGLRPMELMESRVAKGMRTLYMSERWFKPAFGMLRLLHPKYFNMARRFVKLMRSAPSFTYLPIGIHAARDMARLCGLFSGNLRCLFRPPALEFERKPGGRIFLTQRSREAEKQRGSKYCLDKMRMWGYFVEKGRGKKEEGRSNVGCCPSNVQAPLRVLWVGRFLNWKRVDTIIQAVGYLSSQTPQTSQTILLDIYGTGPDEKRLKKLASKYGDAIKFHPPVAIDEVRKLMREHDVYVLSSNGYEGWGAVVSEALEEGMMVVGTHEAGSCATMLPESCLFHAGDWRALAKLLCDDVPRVGIGEWSAKGASEWMMREVAKT